MKVVTEKIGTNKVKMEITVEAAEFEKSMNVAYNKVKGKVSLRGFRPGKAPRKVIEQAYGESIFYEEAFNDAVPKAYDEAVRSEGIYPVDRPDVDIVNIAGGQDFVFTAEVFVKPEFELGQYKGVEVEKKSYPVTDAEIDANIEATRDRNSRWVDAEGDYEAKNGDKLVIDYKGTVDGEAFEGGSADGYSITLGSNTFIPGFEDQMVGMKVGDEKDVNVTFPEEYHAENLKGKPAVFAVKVNGIQYKEMPELDDEFAKDVSEFDTLAEYREDVAKKLNETATLRAEREMESALIEKVAANTEIDIPNGMIESQIDNMVEDMGYRMQNMGISMEQYFQYTGTTMESVREQYKEEAAKTVKAQLVLEKLSIEEGIEATAEEMEAEYEKLANEAKLEVEKVKEMFARDDSYIKGRIVSAKTIEMLKANAVYVEAAANE
ncbi:MAG: trigger factor [Clostridiales bacterium]|nr:trigger factor [Clostridiales bacterium]